MSARTTAWTVMAFLLCGTTSNGALAVLPDDRVTEYYIRETPTDPTSDVLLIATLELTAVGQSGNTITWEITAATLAEPGVGTAEDTVWVDAAPVPATSNGYWEVTHADPTNPQNTEFDLPPLLVGTATAVDPSDDDLDYDFGGDDCDSGCQQLFGGSVGALIYTFQVVSRQQPIAEGDDEPVEIDGEIIVP